MGIKKGASALWVPDQQPLYPDGQHTLAFYIKCVPPVGRVVVIVAAAAAAGLSELR